MPVLPAQFRSERLCYKGERFILKRAFSRFIGVDLGGGRGKTTAVAEIRLAPVLPPNAAQVVPGAPRGSASVTKPTPSVIACLSQSVLPKAFRVFT